MSGSKAALKAINDAVRQKKYDDAIEKARDHVQKDPKSYQGHIFLAFALDKKNSPDEAESVYRTATGLRPQDAQAWQGLIKLYEKQGTKKLPEYQQAVVSLAHIFHDADDMFKCQDVVDKFVDFARANGDPLQYADALWIMLPESPLYQILEGRFPPPAKTYENIAHILEGFEKKRINTLIGERRTRLGAKLNEVTLEVKREIYAQSKLEGIFRQLINWTSDDEVRRSYEEKLLNYCYDRLLAVAPGPEKAMEQEKVLGLANDMVIIDHPLQLAWDIAINWKDEKEVAQWDIEILRRYCAFFPDSDLSKVVMAFLTSTISPFPKTDQLEKKPAPAQESDTSDDDDDDGGVPTLAIPMTDEDRLGMMTEGITTSDSPFAFRLVGEFFLHVGEYETTVELMRKAQDILSRERAKTGLAFNNMENAYSLSLGTALVYYQSPRHHQEAKRLFDKVLERDTSSTAAMIGVGLIFEEEDEYDQAIDFLTRALSRDDANLRVKSEAAWVKALKGDLVSAKEQLLECIEPLEKQRHPAKQLLADTQYRIGYCIWNLETSREARKRRKGDCAYSYWLDALRNNPDHAASYTSLGVFYADYAKDKKRARRCFQKALELSPSEVVAAERLARSFANDGDWDRVELVAQRVVDSGKVKPPPGSKRKGISWPFAALGVAELNKQDYHKAIVSFQSALRITPEDYHSWVGLGESYHNSGRYVAATKAIVNAQKLEEDSTKVAVEDVWFTKYMLANIKRELGEYDESISLYKEAIEARQDDEGVSLALLQTTVENALHCIEKGLFGKAAELALDAISLVSMVGASISQAFNYWKSLAEACSVFSFVQSRVKEFPVASIYTLLEKSDPEAFKLMASVDKVLPESIKGSAENGEAPSANLTRCLHAAILCHKQAIFVSSNDIHAQAVAHYNLGWAEYRASVCLTRTQAKADCYRRAAVRAFKRAIELEPGNSEFWNSLGVVTSDINPSVAQHAFVRSLHLNERSPVAWTNLGTLALLAGDTKVANEAFTRAQSADPDYAHAWLGQGFLALLHGLPKEARGLFTHAMDMAESSSLPTRRHYASSMFDYILTGPPNSTTASLVQPLFALDQVHSQRPQDLALGHLSALFLERTRDNARGVEGLERICSTIEADYETTESLESLARFTLAKTDLARAYLSVGSYDEAFECGETALGLSSSGDDDSSQSELSSEQRKNARLSAHLTVGLAKYYAGEFDEAVTYFESALEESDNNPDAACLLAQVLWAQGSDPSRERARDSLFSVIEQHPDHVQSVLLLGAIALLDADEASLEAVVEELQNLRTNDRVTDNPTQQSHISQVLRAIAASSPESSEQQREDTVLARVQNDVMLYPHLPHGWAALAQVTANAPAARMALKVALRGIPPRGVLEAEELGRAYAGTGAAADAQRAVVLAPWEKGAWGALETATASV